MLSSASGSGALCTLGLIVSAPPTEAVAFLIAPLIFWVVDFGCASTEAWPPFSSISRTRSSYRESPNGAVAADCPRHSQTAPADGCCPSWTSIPQDT